MSIFEAGMLICFGVAWPINIYNSLKTRSTKGKSLLFLGVVWLGYVMGITHKIIFSRDIILVLYIINLVMVSIDLFLYFLNKRRELREAASQDMENEIHVSCERVQVCSR